MFYLVFLAFNECLSAHFKSSLTKDFRLRVKRNRMKTSALAQTHQLIINSTLVPAGFRGSTTSIPLVLKKELLLISSLAQC